MIQFSVGYGAHNGFEEAIAKHRDRICEVHCVPPFLVSSAGNRSVSQDHPYVLRLHRFLHLAQQEKIPVNLLLDPFCVGGWGAAEGCEEDLLTTARMYVDLYGIATVTLSSIADMEMVRKEIPGLAICCSESMGVRHPAQARQVSELADVIVLAEDVNHDLTQLRAIREAYGRPIRLVANVGCVQDCVGRAEHQNAMSHVAEADARKRRFCRERFKNDPGILLKSTLIRPADVRRYEGIADSMKLISAFWPTERVGRLISAYVAGRGPQNLWSIAAGGAAACAADVLATGLRSFLADDKVPEDYFDKVTTCDRQCGKCGYCDRIAADADDEDALARAVRMALQ